MRALLLLPLLLAGCASDTTTIYEVEVSGVVTWGDAAGPVEVQLHVEEAGEGELTHPLGEIDRFATALETPFTFALDYPWDDGRGLVIYAWHDLDGDGVLCAPGQADEPAGLIVVEDFPAHTVDVALELVPPCQGPEDLLP
jgi:hypothetical protein